MAIGKFSSTICNIFLMYLKYPLQSVDVILFTSDIIISDKTPFSLFLNLYLTQFLIIEYAFLIGLSMYEHGERNLKLKLNMLIILSISSRLLLH
uniref:7TM_GPCR_Srx domain-containing protein n=1 Tax=Strongyloides papillosus TaxID=174720 RepID=A0A0N5BGY8_STREA